MVIGIWAAAGGEALAEEAGQQGAANAAVIEQKLKLLNSVLASPRISQIAAGRDPDAALLVDQARRTAEEARSAFAAGDAQRAGALLDQALKACSTASLRIGRSAEEDTHLRARNQEMLQEVISYRRSLSEAAKEGGGTRGAAELGRIDGMISRASEFIAANQQAEAGRLLREAYELAVALLSELRAGETIVAKLKFDSPADEFAYEQRSNNENVALVRQMMREGKIPSERQQYVEHHLQASLQYRIRADELAARGELPAAIAILEKANAELLNAVMTASGIASF